MWGVERLSMGLHPEAQHKQADRCSASGAGVVLGDEGEHGD